MTSHGITYEPSLDAARIASTFERVLALMSDGEWRTLGEIRGVTGGSEAGISARLRDCRKIEFGSHTVDRRRRGDASSGLHEYRLTIRRSVPTVQAELFGGMEAM